MRAIIAYRCKEPRIICFMKIVLLGLVIYSPISSCLYFRYTPFLNDPQIVPFIFKFEDISTNLSYIVNIQMSFY